VTAARGRQMAGFIGQRQVAGDGRATVASQRTCGRALAG
jgi:hypothetical protein